MDFAVMDLYRVWVVAAGTSKRGEKWCDFEKEYEKSERDNRVSGGYFGTENFLVRKSE